MNQKKEASNNHESKKEIINNSSLLQNKGTNIFPETGSKEVKEINHNQSENSEKGIDDPFKENKEAKYNQATEIIDNAKMKNITSQKDNTQTTKKIGIHILGSDDNDKSERFYENIFHTKEITEHETKLTDKNILNSKESYLNTGDPNKEKSENEITANIKDKSKNDDKHNAIETLGYTKENIESETESTYISFQESEATTVKDDKYNESKESFLNKGGFTERITTNVMDEIYFDGDKTVLGIIESQTEDVAEQTEVSDSATDKEYNDVDKSTEISNGNKHKSQHNNKIKHIDKVLNQENKNITSNSHIKKTHSKYNRKITDYETEEVEHNVNKYETEEIDKNKNSSEDINSNDFVINTETETESITQSYKDEDDVNEAKIKTKNSIQDADNDIEKVTNNNNENVTEENENITEENKIVTKKDKNETEENRNVSDENITEENKNVMENNENVTEEIENVTEENENVTKGNENVTEENENVTKENENVTRENINTKAHLQVTNTADEQFTEEKTERKHLLADKDKKGNENLTYTNDETKDQDMEVLTENIPKNYMTDKSIIKEDLKDPTNDETTYLSTNFNSNEIATDSSKDNTEHVTKSGKDNDQENSYLYDNSIENQSLYKNSIELLSDSEDVTKDTKITTDTNENLTEDRTENITEDRIQNADEDTDKNVTEYTDKTTVEDTYENLTKDKTENDTEDRNKNATEDTDTNVTKDTDTNVVKDRNENITINTDKNKAKNRNENLTKDRTENETEFGNQKAAEDTDRNETEYIEEKVTKEPYDNAETKITSEDENVTEVVNTMKNEESKTSNKQNSNEKAYKLSIDVNKDENSKNPTKDKDIEEKEYKTNEKDVTDGLNEEYDASTDATSRDRVYDNKDENESTEKLTVDRNKSMSEYIPKNHSRSSGMNSSEKFTADSDSTISTMHKEPDSIAALSNKAQISDKTTEAYYDLGRNIKNILYIYTIYTIF